VTIFCTLEDTGKNPFLPADEIWSDPGSPQENTVCFVMKYRLFPILFSTGFGILLDTL
jgi:hypothetical protein